MPLRSKRSHQEDHWIPLADLMTGLMMFFMLLAICYMIKVEADNKKMEEASKKTQEIAVMYDKLRLDLYRDLQKQFQDDLPKWGAELDKDLTIRFKEPEVLFDTGSSDLKPKFKTILDDFFPRYLAILTEAKYRDSIEEIRIEGHTSSLWTTQTPADDAYFKNMELSQSRTRSTLQYVLELPNVQPEKGWLRKYLTANGLSSSKTICFPDGQENAVRSQRVEFKVRTDADARMEAILNAGS